MLSPRARCASFVRACVVLSTVALVACSGGGGGGSPAALTLTPSSTSALPGGAAIALHATVTGSSATPAWSLAGPGALSAASGTDISYTPPASTPGNEAATATITASVAGVSKQAQVALGETDGPGHHWHIGLAAGTNWTDIHWGGGRFVAVGFGGSIATSTDGQQWAHPDSPDRITWYSAAYGAGVGWVVVGGDRHVATSPDGVTWTLQPTLQDSPSANQVACGNGVFVAVGGGASWVSADGKTWTPMTAHLSSIAFGNGVFVGTDSTGPMASTDGRTWPASASVDGAQAGDGVAFGNGVFVATTGLAIATSPDGTHWTPVASPPFNPGRPSFAVDRFYLQMAGNASSDGRTWDATPSIPGGIGAANADGTVVVALTTDSSTTPANTALGSGPDIAHLTPLLPGPRGSFSAIGCGGAGCLALMPGYAFRSDAPASWTAHVMGSDAGALSVAGGIAHVGPFDTYVVAGSRGNDVACMTSLDGIAWLEAPIPANVSTGGGGAQLATAPQGLLGITGAGVVLTSTGGGDWTQVARVDMSGVTSVVYGGGRYVAVGFGTATSTDGVTWTTGPAVRDSSDVLTFRGVVFDGTQFVAVAERGWAATSPDGTTWTLHATASTAWLYAIARTDNGELVAVGDDGVVQTSIDGVHWTLRDSGTHRWLRAVTAVSNGFYAAGEDNVILYSSN